MSSPKLDHRDRPKEGLTAGLVPAVLMAIFTLAPKIADLIHLKLRLVVIVVGLIGVLVECGRKPLSRGTMLFGIAAVSPYVLVMTALCSRFGLGAPHSYDLERLGIELPLYVLLGVLLVRAGRIRVYASALVVVGDVIAALACAEYALGRSLVGREADLLSYSRGGTGQVRALVFSEQPLVLGALFAACIPLVYCARLPFRRASSILLLLGSFSTGSRGPSIIGVACALIFALPWLTGVIQRYSRALRGIAALILCALGTVATFIWQPLASGATSEAYSTQYRIALYSTLPRILINRPLGYGLGGLPPGRWLVQSKLFGVRDLAQTVDSEIVLAAATFGIVGLALVLIAGWYSALAVRISPEVGLSAIVIWVSGLFLALHAWDSIGALWYLLIGGSIWLARNGDCSADATHAGVDRHAKRRAGEVCW